jgi:hypothetical protein
MLLAAMIVEAQRLWPTIIGNGERASYLGRSRLATG